MFLLHNWWSIKLGADKLIQLFTGKSWVYVILASKFAFVIKKIGVKLLWNFNHYFQTCSIKTSALNHALYTSENTSVSFSKKIRTKSIGRWIDASYISYIQTHNLQPPPPKKMEVLSWIKNSKYRNFFFFTFRNKSKKLKS